MYSVLEVKPAAWRKFRMTVTEINLISTHGGNSQ
jgi:hypothetical protein